MNGLVLTQKDTVLKFAKPKNIQSLNLITFNYLFMKSLEKFIDRISTLLFGNQKNVTSKLF